MSLGHNMDFEAYCVVGEIMSKLKNVYAETDRYNYGPVFMCIQGFCYKIAQFISKDSILTFRVLMVGILTLTDLGIALWLSNRYSLKHGIIFFLNPVSIIITGFHNQFDNIAVLLALISTNFYNEEKEIGKKDWLFVVSLTTCLMTKHILFIIPFWILIKKGLPIGKRVLYAIVPPALFLISFIPFMAENQKAFAGIMKNVFFYRSYNNFPLLGWILEGVGVRSGYWFFIYIAIMVGLAFVVRKQTYEYQVLFYLISMVTFSSAIANQYLIIPIVALCVLSKGIWRNTYFVVMSIYLAINNDGLQGILAMEKSFEGEVLSLGMWFNANAYRIGVSILLIIVCMEIIKILNLKKWNIKDIFEHILKKN